MSHKDAPERTPQQIGFEEFWIKLKGPGCIGFGRGKDGSYLSEFARDAWAAWQRAHREGYHLALCTV